MTDAQRMHALFMGSDIAHGRSELIGSVSNKGKHEAKSWTEKRAATVNDWELHIQGKRGLGIMPLMSDNRVKFGAIDIDVYRNFSLEELNQSIVQELKMPLILCRSKSGGPHVFLFVEEPVPASEMIEKLDAIAGYLGHGTSEIFPKQAMINPEDKSSTEYGSFINMPYYGGTQFLRYALDEKDQALKTVGAFCDYAQARSLAPEDFRALVPPTPLDTLPEGPPCLNRIMAGKPSDMRNIILSNVAVYAKKAHPETWEVELDKYNQQFPEPLGSSEVETIKKSYGKKDYRYQCSKQPLCAFCDASACKKVKHGIGGQELLPVSRSLTKVNTIPAIWYLDVGLPDGTTHRISLDTEQLQSPRLFQRRCMEVIHQMPPTLKAEDWQPIVQQLMLHVTVIDVPEETTPKGQFIELFQDFLLSKLSEAGYEDLLRALVYRDIEGYHFCLKHLWAFLRSQRFDLLRQNEMLAVLKNDLKATRKFKRIGGRGVNFLTVSGDSEYVPTALPTPEFKSDY